MNGYVCPAVHAPSIPHHIISHIISELGIIGTIMSWGDVSFPTKTTLPGEK